MWSGRPSMKQRLNEIRYFEKNCTLYINVVDLTKS